MAKRKREDELEEEIAVYVDTSLDTHLVVLVTPLISFSHLKEQIRVEHSKCFPDFGEITISAIKVKRDGNYYHLSESMLLRTAFHGVEGWFVFVDVSGVLVFKQPKSQSVLVGNIERSLANCKKASMEEAYHSLGQPRTQSVLVGNIETNLISCKKAPMEEALNSLGGGLPSKNKQLKRKRNKKKNACATPELMAPVSKKEGAASEMKCLLSKNDDVVSDIFPSKVTETSIGGEVMKKEKRYADCNKVDRVHDAPSVAPFQTAADTEATRGTTPLQHQLEGTSTSSGRILNQESGVDNAGATSGSRVKTIKKTKKDEVDGVKRSHAVKSGQVPISINNVAASDNENALCERAVDSVRIKTAKEGTSLKLNSDPKVLLSQLEPLYLVVREKEKEIDIASPKSTNVKEITEFGNTAKKRKANKAKSSVTEKKDVSSTGQNNDQQSAGKRQKGGDLLQAADSKAEQNMDSSRRRTQSQSKVTVSPKDSVELLEKDHLNEKMRDSAALGTTGEDRLISSRMIETDEQKQGHHEDLNEIPLSQVSNSAVAKKVDKPQASKQKAKKSSLPLSSNGNNSIKSKKNKEDERTCQVATQVNNDTSDAVNSRHIGAELLQPRAISEFEENAEVRSVKPKKKAQNRQTVSGMESSDVDDKSQGCHEIWNEIPLSQLAEVSKLDKAKQKGKKSNLPSSSDGQNVALKKSKKDERASQVGIQLDNDISTGQIGSKLLQPAAVSKPEVNAAVRSVKPKKRSENRQTGPTMAISEISSKELANENEKDSAVSKTADGDLLTNSTMNSGRHLREPGLRDHEELNKIPSQKVSADSAEVRNLDKQRTTKAKRKKPDEPSSVDTSSTGYGLTTSKKIQECEKTSEVDHPLQSESEAEQKRLIGVESLQPPQVMKAEVNVEILSDKTKKRTQKKPAPKKDLPESPSKQPLDIKSKETMERADGLLPNNNVNVAKHSLHESYHVELGNTPPIEAPDGLAEHRKLEKQRASEQKAKKHDLPSSVDTLSKGQNTINVKKLKESEGNVQTGTELQNDNQEAEHTRMISTETLQLHQVSEIEQVDIQSDNTKKKAQKKQTVPATGLQELHVEEQFDGKNKEMDVAKTVDQAGLCNPIEKGGVPCASIDYGSKSSGTSSLSSRNSSESIDQGKDAKEVPKKQDEVHVGYKTPLKNVGEVVNASAQKKGMSAGSSSSTRTPSDDLSSSSSDYSEGESKGDVVTSQHDSSRGGGRAKPNLKLSGMSLKEILTSSSRFKKAKLVASQSQMEDSESQLPEFVPDSLCDT